MSSPIPTTRTATARCERDQVKSDAPNTLPASRPAMAVAAAAKAATATATVASAAAAASETRGRSRRRPPKDAAAETDSRDKETRGGRDGSGPGGAASRTQTTPPSPARRGVNEVATSAVRAHPRACEVQQGTALALSGGRVRWLGVVVLCSWPTGSHGRTRQCEKRESSLCCGALLWGATQVVM